ncbi:MAG: chitobiase/beta-hexosaminidase C-terminal domain-containing protein, partial [Oscillospiraceae bacterium]|nr:chitobiase/beta-hexosaminidase C-terminal domain-containing protein [Oscillospiraceae bacterium]
FPDITTAQMKQAILNGVDVIPGLEDYVITSGKLNAGKALIEASKMQENSVVARINCGGPTIDDYITDTDIYDGNGNMIQQDPDFWYDNPMNTEIYTLPQTVKVPHKLKGAAPAGVYQTGRRAASHYDGLYYKIDNLNPNQTYTVRLHIADDGLLNGRRRLDISINSLYNTPKIPSYHVKEQAGGSFRAHYIDLPGKADQNGQIGINVWNESYSSYLMGVYLNAIEIHTKWVVSPPVVLGTHPGWIDENDEITIECETPGAEIRYTIDGSKPDKNSELYTAPFNLTQSARIRAVAYYDGLYKSEEINAEYSLNQHNTMRFFNCGGYVSQSHRGTYISDIKGLSPFSDHDIYYGSWENLTEVKTRTPNPNGYELNRDVIKTARWKTDSANINGRIQYLSVNSSVSYQLRFYLSSKNQSYVTVSVGYNSKSMSIGGDLQMLTLEPVYSGGSHNKFIDFTISNSDPDLYIHAIELIPPYQTINYDTNAGSDSVINIPDSHIVMEYGDNNISGEIPVRAGYTFAGWSYESNAQTPDYLPNDQYYFNFCCYGYDENEEPVNCNHDVTLYAVWY